MRFGDFVPAPSKGIILQDVLIGLKRFRNAVQWKWFWIEEAKKKVEMDANGLFVEESESNSNKKNNMGVKGNNGLGMGLRKSNKANLAPIASKKVEVFLNELVEGVLCDLDSSESPNETQKSKEIRRLEKILREEGAKVVVPTDKINSFKVVEKVDYVKWVEGHLKSSAVEVSADKLVSIFDEAGELLDDLGDFLSDNERDFIEETLKSRAVPTPKLLIEDHKDKDEEGNYPTRLIVPASNFMAAFPKAGYLGIKALFNKNSIDYQKATIIHAGQLKSKLEKLNLKQGEVTITSFDAVEMYPSIKYKLVEKAVLFFAKDLDSILKQKLGVCLDMIRFGMGNTLLTFVDKYYEYGGEVNIEEKGLTIGGYESTWLADLVAAYLLENVTDIFDPTMFKGIYRDDGLVVFKDKYLLKSEVAVWLEWFQERIDELVESKF